MKNYLRLLRVFTCLPILISLCFAQNKQAKNGQNLLSPTLDEIFTRLAAIESLLVSMRKNEFVTWDFILNASSKIVFDKK